MAFLVNDSWAVDTSKLPPPAGRRVDFEQDVRPIFAENCYSCHGPKKQLSSFRLDRKADALKGGENGQVIIPKKSADSPLIHFVGALDPAVPEVEAACLVIGEHRLDPPP